MSIIIADRGHTYWIPNLQSGGMQRWQFIKRSSKMIQHAEEHPGSNTQDVIRMLIDRTKYLNEVGPCNESGDAIYYLRMALFFYEVRAYRRKKQALNKEAGAQAEEGSVTATRDGFDDIPFTEHEIELRPMGSDGHIIIEEGK